MDHATRSAGATRAALDGVRRAPSLLAGMRAIESLSDVAAVEEDSAAAVRVLLTAVLDPSDQLAAMGAVLALGAVPDERAGSALLTVLRDGPSYLRDHAVWALGGCPLLPSALPALLAEVTAGDFRGMLAQRTLETWALRDPEDVRVAVARRLASTTSTAARSRLVETLGLVPGDATQSLLRAVALGELEDVTTRATAIAALGDPPPARRERGQARGPSMTTITVLTVLASQTGPLSAVAQLALDDLRAAAEPRSQATSEPEDDRRTVAQLFLHADIDGELTQCGARRHRGDRHPARAPRGRPAACRSTRVSRADPLARWCRQRRQRAGRPRPARAPLPVGPVVGSSAACGSLLAALGGCPSRHPSRVARRREGRCAAPADGRRGLARRGVRGARAGSATRPDARTRPARAGGVTGAHRRADPFERGRGRRGRAPRLPRQPAPAARRPRRPRRRPPTARPAAGSAGPPGCRPRLRAGPSLRRGGGNPAPARAVSRRGCPADPGRGGRPGGAVTAGRAARLPAPGAQGAASGGLRRPDARRQGNGHSGRVLVGQPGALGAMQPAPRRGRPRRAE